MDAFAFGEGHQLVQKLILFPVIDNRIDTSAACGLGLGIAGGRSDDPSAQMLEPLGEQGSNTACGRVDQNPVPRTYVPILGHEELRSQTLKQESLCSRELTWDGKGLSRRNNNLAGVRFRHVDPRNA